MIDKLAYKSLVTPEEAIRLSDYRTIKDIEIAKEIESVYQKSRVNFKYELWEQVRLLGIIWNAGRMQGVREERAKQITHAN